MLPFDSRVFVCTGRQACFCSGSWEEALKGVVALQHSAQMSQCTPPSSLVTVLDGAGQGSGSDHVPYCQPAATWSLSPVDTDASLM